jgi:hypothetical protein
MNIAAYSGGRFGSILAWSLGGLLPCAIAITMISSCFDTSTPSPAASSGTEPSGRVVIDLKQLLDPHKCWPEMEFDPSSKLLCLTWTTWGGKTATDFLQLLHYAILDEAGQLRSSSDAEPDPETVATFPRLRLRLLNRKFISEDKYTNMFLGSHRWAVASDYSSFVVVRQMSDLSDVVEFWDLEPPVHKQWSWTRKPQYGPPNSWLDYVRVQGKTALAVTCGFNETVFLDAATGEQFDAVPLQKPGEVEGTLATCVIPERGWLVCGVGQTKRIRVLSLEAPHRILREVGEERVNSVGWSTHWIQAAADGKLILKTTQLSNRVLPFTRETEVYDTDTWKVVWRNVSHEAGGIIISPDGKTIANRQGKVLELQSLTGK